MVKDKKHLRKKKENPPPTNTKLYVDENMSPSTSDPVLSRTRVVLMSVSVASAYLVWGLLISIQPPFYPEEAEKKGATPSQVRAVSFRSNFEDNLQVFQVNFHLYTVQSERCL